MQINTIEYTLVLNGFFNLSEPENNLYENLKKLQESTLKGGDLFYAPANIPIQNSLRFAQSDKNYVASFGNNYISYSFISKKPGDIFNKEKLSKLFYEITNLVEKEYKLSFNRITFFKEVIITDLPKEIVNNGINGFLISKDLGDSRDWDLSFNKQMVVDITNSYLKELTKHYQIYSSTLLRTSERVLCYKMSLATKTFKESIFSGQDVLGFFDNGLDILEESDKEFLNLLTSKIKGAING